jgi:hypothetical protein
MYVHLQILFDPTTFVTPGPVRAETSIITLHSLKNHRTWKILTNCDCFVYLSTEQVKTLFDDTIIYIFQFKILILCMVYERANRVILKLSRIFDDDEGIRKLYLRIPNLCQTKRSTNLR